MELATQEIYKGKVSIVQINLGNRCNLQCEHCHVGGSPEGHRNMDKETAIKILNKIYHMDVEEVDITGGAPEMNENLPMIIEGLAKNGVKTTVRTNLVILDNPKYGAYFDLYKKYRVKLIASLPCYLEENVDTQRGSGTFKSSIKVLKKLNELGYGKDDLELNLVYNPLGDYLPPQQCALEKDYKNYLEDKYDIIFNNLLVLTNNPINKFKEKLLRENKLESYMKLLKENYNPVTIENLMCKTLISVDYAGNVYDCDFNQALGMGIEKNQKFWEINFDKEKIKIKLGEHCYACTAGSGSSCYGVLNN